MRLSLRFVIPLILALGAFAYAAEGERLFAMGFCP